ncbi:MAG: hypothetical protein MSM72_06305 [Firmicutes bacterium]|nr:hypothetical protein [Bacillota bacterium]
MPKLGGFMPATEAVTDEVYFFIGAPAIKQRLIIVDAEAIVILFAGVDDAVSLSADAGNAKRLAASASTNTMHSSFLNFLMLVLLVHTLFYGMSN